MSDYERYRFRRRKVKFMHGLDGRTIIVRVYQTIGGPPDRILLDAPLDDALPEEIKRAIRKWITRGGGR